MGVELQFRGALVVERGCRARRLLALHAHGTCGERPRDRGISLSSTALSRTAGGRTGLIEFASMSAHRMEAYVSVAPPPLAVRPSSALVAAPELRRPQETGRSGGSGDAVEPEMQPRHKIRECVRLAWPARTRCRHASTTTSRTMADNARVVAHPIMRVSAPDEVKRPGVTAAARPHRRIHQPRIRWAAGGTPDDVSRETIGSGSPSSPGPVRHERLRTNR